MTNTDDDWEKWGASAPYYGVLSKECFRPEQLSAGALDQFFASGEAHITAVLSRIEALHGENYRPSRSLDFGCGVGRLTLPLARRSGATTAVDVSTSMLSEARTNCERQSVTNVDFVVSDDRLSALSGSFDLVHSFLVLQHIAPHRGQELLDRLAQHVAPGGYLAVQFYSRSNANPLVRAMVKLRYAFPPANWIRNIIRRRPCFEQPMQLHTYDTATVLRNLRTAGFPEASLYFDEEDGGNFESVFLIARRTHTEASITNRLS